MRVANGLGNSLVSSELSGSRPALAGWASALAAYRASPTGNTLADGTPTFTLNDNSAAAFGYIRNIPAPVSIVSGLRYRVELRMRIDNRTGAAAIPQNLQLANTGLAATTSVTHARSGDTAAVVGGAATLGTEFVYSTCVDPDNANWRIMSMTFTAAYTGALYFSLYPGGTSPFDLAQCEIARPRVYRLRA